MHTVDTTRFLADLDHLRTIGAYRSGVHRPTFGAEDMQSRRWLMARDGGRGASTPPSTASAMSWGGTGEPGPHLLVGSHIETQNHAGWLDGALGVMTALALARAGLAVDVCAYADEEGHWGNMIGSRSLVGDLTEADIDRRAQSPDGAPLRDALERRRAGGPAAPIAGAGPLSGRARDPHRAGHATRKRGIFGSAIVTGIVAIRHLRIVFEGQQDHTGGTTMAERRDAGLSAVRLMAAIDTEFPKVCGERSVWTTGRIVLEPTSR